MELVRFRKFMLVSFALVFVSIAFTSLSVAQGVCPVTDLKVGKVKGVVMSHGRVEVPIPGTKVELFKLDGNEFLVESTLTNEKGLFAINNISKGKYKLVVWFTIEGQTY